MTILSDNYLHYYFDDANLPLFSYKDDILNKDLQTQINEFEQRKKRVYNQSSNLEEAEQILDILTSDKNGIKKEIFESQITEFGSNSGIDNLSYTSLNQMDIEQLTNLLDKRANELVNTISIFKEKLEEYLETVYRTLGEGQNFSQYQDELIKRYIAKKEIPRSDAGQAIIKDFLIHEGLKNVHFTESSGAFETALQNLTMLAYALPELENFSTSRKTAQYSTGRSNGVKTIRGNLLPQLFKIINGKIGGGFRNLTGSGAELAWKKAEITGIQELASEIKQVNDKINAEKDVTVKETGSKSITRMASSGEYVKRVSKGDVEVIIDSNGIKIAYGISVKNYKVPKGKTFPSHITIGTYNNFYDLATNKGGMLPYNLLHYAAARPKKGQKASLETSWNEVKRMVATRNFLDIVAGQGLKAGSDNVLVLVINGSSFTIDEILKAAIKNQDGLAALSIGNSGLPRDRFTSLNV